MPTLANTFEGGTADAAVTTGNSGGASGDAFDLIGVSGTGTVTYRTTPVAHGTRAVQFQANSVDTRFAVWNNTSWAGSGSIYARLYLRFPDATPTNNTQIIQIRETDGVTVGCDVRLSTAGQIQLRAPQTLRYTSTTVIPAGEWVRLELYVVSSATVGRIQARLFTGSNLEGVTPTEEFGSASTNWDTGNGTIGGFSFGISSGAGQTFDAYADSVTFTTDGWPGPVNPPPPVAVAAPYIGIFAGAGAAPVDTAVSPLLVPAQGAWFGATTAATGVQSESTSTGLSQWVTAVGSRPQVLSFYQSGTFNGQLGSTRLTMLDDAGERAIPFMHMKFNSGGATWAQVAAGARDSVIDTFIAGCMTYPHRMFLSIFHEPDDDVITTPGSGFTPTDYRNMWARVQARAAAAGATNLIWVMQYAGFAANAGNAAGSFWQSLLPEVDWICWDPYTWTLATNTYAKLVNNVGGAPSGYTGFYNWATTYHPGVPLMIGETGTGIGPGYLNETQAAAYVDQWTTSVQDFPAIKAFLWWNARGVRDYQVQNRALLTAAMQDLRANPWFGNDTALSY